MGDGEFCGPDAGGEAIIRIIGHRHGCVHVIIREGFEAAGGAPGHESGFARRHFGAVSKR